VSGPGGAGRAGRRALDLALPFTHDELVLRQRYEVVSILNDLLVAIWFIVGSVLFFYDSTAYAGTWCFLLGSVQLAIRPALRLSRQVHLRRRVAARDQVLPHESDDDF